MMDAAIGIVVRSEPYAKRAGRECLDPALAAASLDIPLKVFFIGDGILHLLPGQQPDALPASSYTRAWMALLDLSQEVRLYAETEAAEQVSSWSEGLPEEVRVVDRAAIARQLGDCRAVLHV